VRVRSRFRVALVGLVALVFALAACTTGEPTADIKLDGTPRVPDRAGIVTAVSLEKLAIDGQSFTLSRKLLCFSTYTLGAMPVLSTEHEYVHAGIKDKKIVWVALIARIVQSAGPSGEKQAFYTGTVKTVAGSRVTFVDGTVLSFRSGMNVPPKDTKVLVRIDPATDRVVEVRGA
jgi:hypothetical protein